MIVDVHVHLDPTGLPGGKPKPGGEPEDVPTPNVVDRVRAEMKEAGITHALAMGRWQRPAEDPLGVNATLRIAVTMPEIKAIGVADPTRTDKEHLDRVAKVLASGKVVALKAYLGYIHYGPEHPNYRPYYEMAAQYKIPVVLHTGDNWSTKAKLKYAHPLLVDEVAVDHPDVRFVMAHFGNPWSIDAAEVIFKNDNVWADLSGLAVGDAAMFKKGLDDLKAGRAEVVYGMIASDFKKAYLYADRHDRFVYGSDWPLAPMLWYRRFIETLIPEKHHEAVFSKNAQELFRLS